MSHPRALVAFGAAGAVAIALVSGCSGPSEPNPSGSGATITTPGAEEPFIARVDPKAPSGGQLTVQLDYDAAELGGLDPAAATVARAWMIEGLVYETLVNIDESLSPVPGLALSWSRPDDVTYVFQLDPAATFSNGRTMTAEDVVGSLDRLRNSENVWAAQLGPITSVSVTGEHEVTVVLASPYTPFLPALANTPAAVLPIAELEAGEFDPVTEMLGTGPFVVDEHRQDEYWDFSLNPHYADELGVSSLRLDIVAEETARVASLKNGNSDLSIFNSVDSVGELSAAGLTSAAQRNTDFYYLVVNSRSSNEKLADPAVRAAVNAAVDRDQLNELVFNNQSGATGVTPASLPDACDPAELPSARADIEGAKAVIDAIGGLDVNLIVYTDEPVLAEMAQVMQQQLTRIGVTTKIEQYDFATYSAKVYGDPSDFDLALNWYAGYADPSMVTRWWSPDLAGFSSVFMRGSDELDRLIEAGAATPSGEARAQVLTDLCVEADEGSEMIALLARPAILGWNAGAVSPTLAAREGYGNFLRHIAEYRAS
ncbi:MAG: ABC transporter substrate-binding protein [Bifidobacteriaceae bacterium]|jgi:peptide/nickel transport system substrate-binding protein|nr:ABC transporter substrate-binding protein [Bifidobacteriaceae bacterium]